MIVHLDRRENIFFDIKFISEDDAWSVGEYVSTITPTVTWNALIEHWNGLNWSIVPAPELQAQDYGITGVDGSSSDDIWAVGSYSDPNTGTNAVTLHWDGTRWEVLPVAPYAFPDHLDSELHSISATAANDVWAVGYQYVSDAESDGYIRHWNRSEWAGELNTSSARLYGVAGISANDAWAVGYRLAGQQKYGVALHWNGSNWTDMGAPISYNSSFSAVSASSSSDVWVVGSYGTGTATYLHWNGSDWQMITEQNTYLTTVNDVLSIAPTDAWIVGNGSVHWDGHTLNPVSVGDGREVYAVDSSGSGDIWTAGSQRNLYPAPDQYVKTVVLKFNDPCAPPTATPIPPRCPGERFTDVCPGDYFYSAVAALSNDEILSGYTTSPPCNARPDIPCFKPYGDITRGQIAKVASLAAGFNEPVSGQTFYDVPPGSTFYDYIERMAARGIMQGHPFSDGHCPQQNLPCFYPNRLTTRGQLSKVVTLTFGLSGTVSGQTFEDVPPDSTFYQYIEQFGERGFHQWLPLQRS